MADRTRAEARAKAPAPLPWPWNLLCRLERQPNGCIWHASPPRPDGYGQIKTTAKVSKLHVVAYQLLIGPIPDGYDIDHECHNEDPTCAGGPTCLHRRCINPSHMTAKGHGENVRASPNFLGNRTHCAHGHEFTPENTYRRPNGRRVCRRCKRLRDRRRYRARARR